MEYAIRQGRMWLAERWRTKGEVERGLERGFLLVHTVRFAIRYPTKEAAQADLEMMRSLVDASHVWEPDPELVEIPSPARR